MYITIFVKWYSCVNQKAIKKLCNWFTMVSLFREFKRHFDTTFETLKKKITSGQLKEGEFRFLCYMLGRPELEEKDIVTLTLSRFIDGLSTVRSLPLF